MDVITSDGLEEQESTSNRSTAREDESFKDSVVDVLAQDQDKDSKTVRGSPDGSSGDSSKALASLQQQFSDAMAATSEHDSSAGWSAQHDETEAGKRGSKFKQGFMTLQVAKGTTAPEDMDETPDEYFTFDNTSEAYLAALKMDATQAQEKLIQFLENSGFDSSYKGPGKGREETDEEKKQTKSLSADRRAELSPTKKEERIHEKLPKYLAKGGGFDCFTDVARGSLLFKTPADMIKARPHILKKLQEADMRVVNVKNRFKGDGTPDDHYRDILLNIAVPIGDKDKDGNQATHVCELQLHLAPMVAAKSEATDSLDPKRYEKLRESAVKLFAQHNDKSSPVQFSEKAVHSLLKVINEKDPDKAALSGHDLYNIKRYLFEHGEELTDPSRSQPAPQWIKTAWQIWSEVASDDMYNPAWQSVKDRSNQTNIAALCALDFM